MKERDACKEQNTPCHSAIRKIINDGPVWWSGVTVTTPTLINFPQQHTPKCFIPLTPQPTTTTVTLIQVCFFLSFHGHVQRRRTSAKRAGRRLLTVAPSLPRMSESYSSTSDCPKAPAPETPSLNVEKTSPWREFRRISDFSKDERANFTSRHYRNDNVLVIGNSEYKSELLPLKRGNVRPIRAQNSAALWCKWNVSVFTGTLSVLLLVSGRF